MNMVQSVIEITNFGKMIETLKKLERRAGKIGASLADDEMLMIEYIVSSGERAMCCSGPQESCLKEGEPRAIRKHRALMDIFSGKPTESFTRNFLVTRNGRLNSLRDRESFNDEGWVFLRLTEMT